MVALQALLGFERNLTHLDGHVVELKRVGVTQPGGLWHDGCCLILLTGCIE